MAHENSSETNSPRVTVKTLALAAIYLVMFGFGWGLTALFGYYWVFVEFAAAPNWSVVTAFIVMPFATVLIFRFLGGSPFGYLWRIVVVGAAIWMPWGLSPWLDPFLLATACGLVGIFMVLLLLAILPLDILNWGE